MCKALWATLPISLLLLTCGAGARGREGCPKWACAAEKQQQPKLKQREEEDEGSRAEKSGRVEE